MMRVKSYVFKLFASCGHDTKRLLKARRAGKLLDFSIKMVFNSASVKDIPRGIASRFIEYGVLCHFGNFNPRALRF